ncbi:MAG: molybdopterin-dependent oxidoreductase, partial [Thermoproteus sp.]|nr:molybdopterin-dependent oxidoreductase [Thermoproteus sp.]
QGERIGSVELAVGEDGKILGIRYKFIEDVGAYPRPPEPGALFRVFSVLNGAYDVRAIEADFTVVLTNRLPTGLNRGYGGPQFYFALETAVDKAAEELGLDPFEFRLRNLIKEFPKALAGEQFYETPTGGLYPRQDYAAVLRALEPEYRRLKASKRPGLGVGLAVVVEPSGTNLGYVDLAVEPEKRRYPHSGSGEYVTIWVDPAGYIGVRVNSTNEGLGHETALAEVVAGELGVDPEAVRVEYKVDTAHLWGLASGSYSSRFAPVVASAAILAARRLVEKLTPLAAWLLKAEAVRYEGGAFVDAGDPKRRLELRRLASAVQWDPGSLPEGLTADLSATVYFQPPTVKAPSGDFVNSSATYSIQAHLAVVEVDPDTCQIKVVKYAVAHDAGRIIKRELLDGQLYGSIILGVNMALNEELKYSEDGTPLTTLFDAYESYTLGDVVGLEVDLIHFETPAKFLPSGAHGAGEGPVMGAPAAIANAVADAIDKRIAELPIKPWKLCT